MASIKIVTISSELKSAKQLGWEATTRIPENLSSTKNNVVYVRWGNSAPLYDQDQNYADFAKVINPYRSIWDNCEKSNALEKMSRVVNTPTMYLSRVPANELVVVRPHHHTAGRDFCVKKGPFNVDYGYYATQFIQTDSEYRVWFCGDKTYRCKRVPMKCNTVGEHPCRSEWGYAFAGHDKVPAQLHADVLKAAKAIGLECGAADVLLKDGKYYFLELNSAPSVDHSRVSNFYQENLPILIKQKYNI